MSDFYNRASAHKLGWEPSWFGADEFDETCESAKMKKGHIKKLSMWRDGTYNA